MLAALLLAASAVPDCQAQRLPFRTYSSDHGLAQSVVLSMVQHPDGHLWLGTPDGLSRFDGLRFRTYEKNDGLVDSVVRSLYVDPRGRLWAGTDRGLSYLGSNGWRTAAGVPDVSVRALAQLPDGRFFAGTYGGLIELDVKHGSTGRTVQRLPERRIRCLAADRAGHLWVGTWGGGLARLDSVGTTAWGRQEGLEDLFVRAILTPPRHLPDAPLLVATNGGVFALGADSRFRRFGPAASLDGPVTALLRDSRDRLWLATRDDGVCRIDPKQPSKGFPRCFRLADGLADDSVTSLYEDREGNLWFGTFGGGVSRLSSEAFRVFGVADGLSHPSVRAFVEGADGSLWAGTHGGGLVRLPTAEGDSPTRVEPLELAGMDPKVISAGSDSRGNAWFGTLDGVVRFEPSRDGAPKGIMEPGLEGKTVLSILAMDDGRLLAGTLVGLFEKRDGGPWQRWGPVEGLPDSRVNHLAEDGKGGLYVATGAGLLHVDADGERRVLRTHDGLPDDYVDHLYLHSDGALWIATAGGLVRYGNGRMRAFSGAEGLSHSKVTALTEDHTGRLWIGTTRGIDVFDGNAFLPFGKEDGLISAEVNAGAALTTRDGRVWFGTVRGAVVFEPVDLGRKVPPPPVLITALEARDRPVPLLPAVSLGHRDNHLRFEYVGISLAYPESVTYQVRLDGLDSSWRSTEQRSMEYPVVPPGTYTFEVRARARGGVPSREPASMKVTVHPPTWHTSWFRITAASALLIFAFTLHRYSLTVLEERNRELEEQIAQRLRAEAEVKEYAARLEQQSFYDELTGLPNRALFRDRVGAALDQMKRHPARGFAIFLFDLDRFKLLNESRGRAFGDEVIRACAERLQSVIGEGDTLARLSGDELAILLFELDGTEQANRVANRLLRHLELPIEVDGIEIRQGASVGIALGNLQYEDPGELLQSADTALARAKSKGRSQIRVFEPELQSEANETLELEGDLRQALDRRQLELYYQPIVEVSTGRTVSFEALIRWHHPRKGLMSPSVFLPIAHDAGLLEPMGRWILERATRQAGLWARRFSEHPAIAVGINLFHRQAVQRDLATELARLVESASIDPSTLHLEITENVLIEEPEAAIEALEAAKALGVSIYLDDFGTGYSSLGYLQRFPVDVLKIDRTFIKRMLTDEGSQRIVEAIVNLAHGLRLRVVAEGVETAAQLRFLESLGCDFVQGFLLGKPLTAGEATDRMSIENPGLERVSKAETSV